MLENKTSFNKFKKIVIISVLIVLKVCFPKPIKFNLITTENIWEVFKYFEIFKKTKNKIIVKC